MTIRLTRPAAARTFGLRGAATVRTPLVGGLAAALLAGLCAVAATGPAHADPAPTPSVSATPTAPTAPTAPTGGAAPPDDAASGTAEPGTGVPGDAGETAEPDDTTATGAGVRVDPADAERQASLVDREDQRLIQTRAVLAAIMQIGGTESAKWKQPQVFTSVHGRTLVLPERNDGAAYTIDDLAAAGGGKYVRKLGDGSYLLGVNVFVADGAVLELSSGRTPLVLRMGSIPGAFSSIIGFGGDIAIEGTTRAPVRITSWNPATRRPDLDPVDGRAYIRAVGGRFRMRHAEVEHLGFWSGRTGGIALTGTDRPAGEVKHRTKQQRHADKRQRLERNTGGPAEAGGGPGDVEVESPGEPGGTASHVPAEDLVTGAVRDSTITGNAYGLFVSGSNQTQIVGNTIAGSLVHGVLMHRFAKNANIEKTVVRGSGADGFVLSRATEKVRVTECTAAGNARNGFTLNGRALADGPSASGESLISFGDSSVNRSIASGNGRYGIELLGGDRLAVQGSTITGGDMGIVVRAQADGVQISGNRVTGQRRHGIALRDGVTGASVAGNTVENAVTGIYLRDSTATIVGNTVRAARVSGAHGIAVVGDASGTEISSNTLAGAGTSAVRTSSSHGKVIKRGNDTGRWRDTSSLWMKSKRVVKPMNIVWAGVFLLVVVSAVRSRESGSGRSTAPGRTHPYARQHRMEERTVMVLPRRRRAARTAAAQRPPLGVSAGAPQIPRQGHWHPVTGGEQP